MPATIAEPARGLFRRAKAVMKGANAAEQLEAALRELRAIVNQQGEAEQKAERQIELLSAAVTRARAAGDLDKAFESGSVESVYEALKESCLGQLMAEKGAEMSRGLQVVRYEQETQLPSAARNVLLRVCQLRLAMARSELERITAEEQARLDREHGAGECNAEDSQPVKRQAVKVDVLATRSGRITSNEPLNQVWLGLAEPLLDDE